MDNSERDTHFLGFAKLLYQELGEMYGETIIHEDLNDRDKQSIQRVIAQRAYDLVRCAAISISVAQMTQGGVTLHPNAMLRAVPDLTGWEWPLDAEFTQSDVWKEEKALATDLSECPDPPEP